MMRFLPTKTAQTGAVLRQNFRQIANLSTSAARRAVVPPPAAVPRPKTHRLRNTLVTAVLLLTTGYVGGVYLAVKNDAFYTYFTKYVPLSTVIVDSAEDFLFRQQLRGHVGSASPPATRVSTPRSDLMSVDGKSKANATIREPVPSVKAGVQPVADHKLESKPEKFSKPTPEHKVVTETKEAESSDSPEAVEVTPESHVETVKYSALGPVKELDHPTKLSHPAEVSLMDPEVLERMLADPVSGLLADELDPLIAKLADTVNSALRAHGVKLEESEYTSLLTAAFEDASQALQHERAAVAQQQVDALHQQQAVLEDKFDSEYLGAKANLVDAYNQRLQLALNAITERAVKQANNQLTAQYLEMTERFAKEVNTLVESERDGRLSELALLKEDVKRLQTAMLSSGQILESEDGVVSFFVELANLQRALNNEKPVPLQPFLDSLTRALPSDPLVKAVVQAFSPSVKRYGVLSHSQLAARFGLVEPEIRRASLVPPDAGIAGHLGSLAASQLLAKKEGLPKGGDVESILARTQTYLQRGDIIRAVAEVNSLQGWPKRIATDWLDEGRKRSEAEFLVNVLSDEGRLWSVSRK